MNNLTQGLPTFEEVARSLNISHQHLWRKLNQEGNSYQKIKNQLRGDIAVHFLLNTNLNISEISLKAGYATERTFYRMFKTWTGMSPGKYRILFKT